MLGLIMASNPIKEVLYKRKSQVRCIGYKRNVYARLVEYLAIKGSNVYDIESLDGQGR